MAIVPIVTKLLAYLVFFSQISLLIYLIHIGVKKASKKSLSILDRYFSFVEKHALVFALSVALASTLGSLFFSEVAGYTPCELCWFQRIFMYPQVVILGLAIYLKKKDYAYSTLALSVIGILVSTYQNIGIIISKLGSASACSANGTSCFTNFFTELSYINIPMMALTGFALLIVLSLMALKKGKR